ncbi:MAG: hypothetical protein HPY57_14145 [Ignavibacteria bacterium]|nr:hypothetical protein [Ignavibacteria bacterium]
MKHLKHFESYFEDYSQWELDELLAYKRKLENKIDDYFSDGHKYTGDQGYQDLLEDLDAVEEAIKEKEKLSESANITGHYPFDAYPGPQVVNTASNFLTAGASDGSIGGSGNLYGQTGVLGGEFPKKYQPSTPYPDKFKQTIINIQTKESRKRKNALKKLQRLDKLVYFDNFENK